MSMSRVVALMCLALLVMSPLYADDVCEPGERQQANAMLSRAQAAEDAGDLPTALRTGDSSEVRACGDQAASEALVRRVTERLGKDAEARGDLTAAFNYYERGGWYAEAKRVGLKGLAAAPRDWNLTAGLKDFMNRHQFADGAAEIQKHARRQAEQLIADEAKAYSPRTPQPELIQEARRWLMLAGDSPRPAEDRALKRADDYLAMDYAFAMRQALSHYSIAGREDRHAAVQSKARSLAEPLATGNDWMAAVELYEIAGDYDRAESLRAQRERSAQATEATRQETFRKEQADLEKELGL